MHPCIIGDIEIQENTPADALPAYKSHKQKQTYTMRYLLIALLSISLIACKEESDKTNTDTDAMNARPTATQTYAVNCAQNGGSMVGANCQYPNLR